MERKPSRAEYKEGRDNGLTVLRQRMKRDGILFNPRNQEVYVHSKIHMDLDLEYACVKLKRYMFA